MPKPRTGGRPPKDSPISDNFNSSKLGVKKKDIAAAKREAKIAKLRVKQVQERTGEVLEAAAQDAMAAIKQVAKQAGIKAPDLTAAIPDPESEEVTSDSNPDPDEDEKSAYKMLQDLRYAYRNAKGETGKKGRARLLELMVDDKEFKYMVKQLLTIETSLMAAKIRKGEEGQGGTQQQNFFVVLKGLEDEKKVMGTVDRTVDMKQIERAINPTSDSSWQADEEESRNAAPEQLSKTNVEDW